LDVQEQGSFCWDDPASNRFLVIELLESKVFSIDIDRFLNEEIVIDKQFDESIEKEFRLEIYIIEG
jgi:hypothetical protein